MNTEDRKQWLLGLFEEFWQDGRLMREKCARIRTAD